MTGSRAGARADPAWARSTTPPGRSRPRSSATRRMRRLPRCSSRRRPARASPGPSTATVTAPSSPTCRDAAEPGSHRPEPGRAGARRARDRLDRRPLAPGQGPDRAAVGHVPGPARVELRLAGVPDLAGANAFLPGLPRPLQRPLRRAGRRPGAGLAVAPGRSRTSSGSSSSSTAQGRPRPHRPARRSGPAAAAGPGRPGHAGKRVEVHVRLDGSIVAFDGARDWPSLPAPADPASCGPTTPAAGPGPRSRPPLGCHGSRRPTTPGSG